MDDCTREYRRAVTLSTLGTHPVALRLDAADCRAMEEKGFRVEHDGSHRIVVGTAEGGALTVTFRAREALSAGETSTVSHQLLLHHAANMASTIAISLTAVIAPVAVSHPPVHPPPPPSALRMKSQSPAASFRTIHQWLSVAAQTAYSPQTATRSLVASDVQQQRLPQRSSAVRGARSLSTSTQPSSVPSPAAPRVSPLPSSLRRASEPHCYTLQPTAVFTPSGSSAPTSQDPSPTSSPFALPSPIHSAATSPRSSNTASSSASQMWGDRRPHARSLSVSLAHGDSRE